MGRKWVVRFALPVVLFLLAAGGAGATRADNPVLTGDVGASDAFTISLHGPDGAPVKNLDPGTYTLIARDHSTLHSFHLFGPGGVDVATSIENIETKTFTVTLVAGTYTFLCDAHGAPMKGTFTVGAASAPPPVIAGRTKLNASVGPGAKIALRRADGSALSGRHGLFTIVVNDRSATDNFHLVGPGVSKATGVAFKGTVTWKVSLKAGSYTFRSDKHHALHGAFKLK
jgi:hypothetical protein